MIVRNAFEKGTAETNAILEKYAPTNIASIKDIAYRDGDQDALFDLYYTNKNKESAPTVLWVHGGGWLAGNKSDMDPWARILADKGLNVISLNYSIAPEKQYPLPVVQTNAALRYLSKHAAGLNIDLNKLILAGDSAGAQIVAQASLIETNPEYAQKMNLQPGLSNGKIAALLLNCGPYDLGLVDPNSTTDGAKLVRTFLWAYAGSKDFAGIDKIDLASIPPYVTADFPPSFVTAGNIDPLLPHSESLVKALKNAGVTTDTLFYPEDYAPALNHEYQFNLDTKEGMLALERMVEFSFAQVR